MFYTNASMSFDELLYYLLEKKITLKIEGEEYFIKEIKKYSFDFGFVKFGKRIEYRIVKNDNTTN